jgi:hypothetical protein
MPLLPLFPTWTTPSERLLWSASGNLQLLLRSFYNEPIQLNLLSHQIVKSNASSTTTCDASFVEIPAKVIQPLSLLQQLVADDIPALATFLNQECHQIKRSISLAIQAKNQKLTRSDSHCFLKASASSQASSLAKNFLEGSVGIGQFYRRKGLLPNFKLLHYGRLDSSSLLADDGLQPKSFRQYILWDEDLLCIIDELFYTNLSLTETQQSLE